MDGVTSRHNNILNVYFFSKSYKTAVKSPGDSSVFSAGLFIENMLFDAAVIQSNAVKHCKIHFGEQLLQVKTRDFKAFKAAMGHLPQLQRLEQEKPS